MNNESRKKVRCLEFFSGIGAMHFALNEISSRQKIDFQVVEAFDINTNANQTYSHNFPPSKPKAVNVEHIAMEKYQEYNADFWLLSPPCQPFTRGGKGLDAQDARSSGLLFLIQLLQDITPKPKYFFLENVLNFERSQCRNKLVAVLRRNGYQVKEYLTSPLQIGTPNNRLRYYLTAVRTQETSKENSLKDHHEISTSLEQLEIISNVPNADSNPQMRQLQSFLQPNVPDSFTVPREYLEKCKNFTFDIVTPTSTYSSTFTKAYGTHQIVGTGSLLSCLAAINEDEKSNLEAVLRVKPRFFTPQEIARLHEFPDSFSFPSTITIKQQYKLLGNSMNVKIVAFTIEEMFLEEQFLTSCSCSA